MATVADSLIASSARPLALRMRPDLVARRHQYQRHPYWVVKEPIGLKYFRLQEEEYAILRMLDGHRSLEDIKNSFEREYAPQKITFADLQHFIGSLHRSGLVISTAPGQGMQLWQRSYEQKKKKILGALSNVFAVRWRGIDPERLLNFLYPYTRWFFTWTALTICLLIALAALTLVAVQFDVLRSRLPTFQEFFGPKNWVWLALTLGVVKILHEFGHGLSCKHFRGECHEIGFMLLVFTPALYCNVSDSWLLESKWKRAAIGAAGMYVELVLASIATFLWWFSAPGLLNHIALNVMFICSVSTILFNGNPLLRFDGYYILADLVEIPNLRQKASEVLRRLLLGTCLGIELPEDPFLPKRNRIFMATYTVAAVVYRWLIVFSILLFLNAVLEPYGLKILGRIIGLIGFFGLVVQPTWQLAKFLHVPGRMKEVKRHRVLIALSVLAAIVLAIVMIPLPRHVYCSLTIEPTDAATAYVDVPGRLEKVFVKPNVTVVAGQPLARLRNEDLEVEVLRLEANRDRLATELENLERQRFNDPSAALHIPESKEKLVTATALWQEKYDELDRLIIRAPAGGTVFPAEARRANNSNRTELPTWSGTLLEEKNQGTWLTKGEAICRVGDPNDLSAVLIVDQADVDFVKQGQQVRIQLDAHTGRTVVSTIEQVAERQMDFMPASLSNKAGGDVATRSEESGAERPISASYQALVPLGDKTERLQIGARGQARIYTGYQTLGGRVWRYLTRTFHFTL